MSETDLSVGNAGDPPARGSIFDDVMHDQPPWVGPTVNALRELLNLPPNWNSYGARPVDRALVQSAFGLLIDAAGEKDLPAPIVVPTSRGGVQFEWHTRGIDLELEVKSGGRHHLFFEDTQHHKEWEGDFQSNLQPLVNALDELARHV